LQLFEREADQAGEAAVAFTFKLGQFTRQRPCQCGLTATVATNKGPALTSVESKIGKATKVWK
jgi:hypothetical protein